MITPDIQNDIDNGVMVSTAFIEGALASASNGERLLSVKERNDIERHAEAAISECVQLGFKDFGKYHISFVHQGGSSFVRGFVCATGLTGEDLGAALDAMRRDRDRTLS